MKPFVSLLALSSIYLSVDCNEVSIDPKVTLNSLEDVEVLTYFLLWKYNYFHNNNQRRDKTSFDLNDETFEDNDSDIESKLLLFIENLKDNKLIQHITNSSSVASIDTTIRSCDHIDNRLISKWATNTSTSKLRSICEAASGCKSAKQLIQLIDSPFVKPGPLLLSQSIVRLCPLILFQLQEHQCIEQRESHYKALNRPNSGAVWGFGLLFVTIVSFCSLIGVAILPLLTRSTYDVMLTLFEGL
ncbi:unnamed protein product, partial [Oppiella nova]